MSQDGTQARLLIGQDPYSIRLPNVDERMGQDEEYCILHSENGHDDRRQIRFHDYDKIYDIPGLYERIFYDLLECSSPEVVTGLLAEELAKEEVEPAELRAFDLGAGNGMVGEALAEHGIEHIVGADLLPEAAAAASRDRPGIYDDYIVGDITEPKLKAELAKLKGQFECVTCVAALGFGDIPPEAFAVAYNLVSSDGWVAFNIKDAFISEKDKTGFSQLIDQLTDDGRLEIQNRQRYRHRLAVDGSPLDYVAFVGRKHADVPDAWLEELG